MMLQQSSFVAWDDLAGATRSIDGYSIAITGILRNYTSAIDVRQFSGKTIELTALQSAAAPGVLQYWIELGFTAPTPQIVLGAYINGVAPAPGISATRWYIMDGGTFVTGQNVTITTSTIVPGAIGTIHHTLVNWTAHSEYAKLGVIGNVGWSCQVQFTGRE